MSKDVRSLEPKAIWNYFEDLNAVPRGSKKEDKAVAFFKEFGKKYKIDTTIDEMGNVVFRKPATKGKEKSPIIVLQGHMDMVHQKNSDTVFDFDKQGIQSVVDGDWVRAKGTTLGADNGIGVAAAMAILTATDVAHPALEVLITVDEETGMTGAHKMDPKMLKGRIMFNLDTEDENELCIGCAGGIDTLGTLKYKEEKTPAGMQGFKVTVKGLKGGHSGMDIILGRANANKVLNRMLWGAGAKYGLRLSVFDGGSLRNAIPREAFAEFALPKGKAAAYKKHFKALSDDIKKEYKTVDEGMEILLEPIDAPKKVMPEKEQKAVVDALAAMPNGVFCMSPDVEGLVQTSSNMARVEVRGGKFAVSFLTRSSVDSSKMEMANGIRSTLELAGCKVEQNGGYSGWAPNPHSPVLLKMVDLYKKMFKKEPHVAACHAGLECGIIGGKYPEGMDMVSFGPTIMHPHSPDEKVKIDTVGHFYDFLKEVLKSI